MYNKLHKYTPVEKDLAFRRTTCTALRPLLSRRCILELSGACNE